MQTTQVSRRHFINAASTGLAAAACLQLNPSRAAEPPLRVRRNVATLAPDHPDILALKTAVTRMRALPASDRRSWENQAAIHGTANGGFGSCRHGSWLFLPWHRAYLYCFEEIVRELSGNNNFALPYWDWSVTDRLPSHFVAADSPLFIAGRRATENSIFTPQEQSGSVGLGVISAILATTDFETFGGSAVNAVGSPSAIQGTLENQPHNFIHRWVGGVMGSGGSPLDPIFWLHHCNIDRIWSEWDLRNPGRMPAETTAEGALWRNMTFAGPYRFYDRIGNPLETLKVGGLLTTEPLGYTYRPVRPQAPSGLRLLDATTASTSATSTTSASSGASAKIKMSATEVQSLQAGLQAVTAAKPKQTIRMTIRNIKVPADIDTLLQVHVNCKLLTPDLDISDPTYVATSTFFGHGHAGHGGDAHGEETVSFFFNLNPVFARLYADRPFTTDEPITVGVIAKPLFDKSRPAQVINVPPENIRIQVLN